MQNIIKKIIEDKKEYREQMKRSKNLPEDYRFVFEKIEGYLWSFAGGDGYDMLKTQYDLIELFEAGVVQGKHVLEVTGDDVAGFCDELIRDNKLWIDKIRNKTNLKVQKKLEKWRDPKQK